MRPSIATGNGIVHPKSHDRARGTLSGRFGLCLRRAGPRPALTLAAELDTQRTLRLDRAETAEDEIGNEYREHRQENPRAGALLRFPVSLCHRWNRSESSFVGYHMDRDTTDIIASFEHRLKDVDRVLEHHGAHTPRRWTVRRIATAVITVLLATILPFVALVRLSSWVYLRFGYPTWGALATALAVTVVIVTLGAGWFSRALTGRARLLIVGKWVALPLVLAYCSYALLYVADANTKTAEVRAFYRSLHPILRIGLSTLILADDGLVITDLARTEEDYERMGLPVRERSHHYVQPDGYVHAADLRTIGRGHIRNLLVEGYFQMMGFRTLRHVGTADHLHVGLDVRKRDRPH